MIEWPFSGLFFEVRVIRTSEGCLLKLAFKDSSEFAIELRLTIAAHLARTPFSWE